ncbi:MAG: metallophosphoesterase family protein [Bacillota bacterium]|jgi:putative phosphoesterase
MKISVFSDVHGNLAALEAVLSDIRKRSVDYIFCAGDLVGCGPFPNEVVQLISDHNIPCLMGNYDDAVAFDRESSGLDERSVHWTKAHISEECRKILSSLPQEIRFEVNEKRLLLVHGSPAKLDESLGKDAGEDYLQGILNQEEIDLLICGHTHVPFLKKLDKGWVVNAGSIGKPKHGKLSAVYALINITEEVSINFVDVHYPVEVTAYEIEKSELPKEYAYQLRTGK